MLTCTSLTHHTRAHAVGNRLTACASCFERALHSVHDNSQFASCGGDRQPFVWDVATGEIIRKFKGHERVCILRRAGALSLWLVSSRVNNRERLCTAHQHHQVQPRRQRRDHRYGVRAPSSDGDQALALTSNRRLSGSYDKSVKVWDCRSRNAVPIQEMLEARDSVSSIVVSDSEIIAASVDGCVRTYDVRAGQLRTERIGRMCEALARRRRVPDVRGRA